MLGESLADLRQNGVIPKPKDHGLIAVKEAVLPSSRFPETDSVLSPEMRSTGESMGIGADFGSAYAKAEIAAKTNVPIIGTVFITVADHAKSKLAEWGETFATSGFTIVATAGTAAALQDAGISVETTLGKVHEHESQSLPEFLESNEIDLIINIPSGNKNDEHLDGLQSRQLANKHHIPLVTTPRGTNAMIKAIQARQSRQLAVRSLQSIHSLSET